MEKHWVVHKWDAAITGQTRGPKGHETIAGPFEDYEDAQAEKSGWRRHGMHYYCVVQSPTEPPSKEETYEFVDAPREFDDVEGW